MFTNCPQCDDKWTFVEMGVLLTSPYGRYTLRHCMKCKIKWDPQTGKIDERKIISV